MNRYARLLRSSGSAVAASRVVSLVAAAVQLPFLTRVLGPEQFGLVSAALAASTFVSLFAVEPQTLAFQRFPGGAADRANYGYALHGLILTALAVSAAIMVVGAATGDLGIAFAITGWGLGLGAMRFVSTAWLMWFKPWTYAANLSVSTVTRTVVLVSIVYAGFHPYPALGLAGLASVAVALALGPKAKLKPGIERPWPRGLGLSLAVASVAIAVMHTVARAVLPALVGGVDAGRFAAMMALSDLTLVAALTMMNLVLYPRLIRSWETGQHASTMSLVSTSAVVCVMATPVAVLAFSLLGADRISLLLGNGYADIGLLLALLGACGLFCLGQQVSWLYHLSLEGTRLRNRTVFAAAAYVVALPLFSLTWGVQGAVASVVLGFLVYCVALLAYGRWLIRRMLPPALVAVASWLFLANPSAAHWAAVLALVAAAALAIPALRIPMRDFQPVLPPGSQSEFSPKTTTMP